MNKNKSIMLIISALALSAVLLSGCGKKSQDTTPTPSQEPSPGVTQTPAEQGDSLLGVADMVGKTDAEVKELYNGGTENKTADGSILIGRTYTATLDGKGAVLETIYTDDQKVSAVTVSFDDATAEEIKTALMRDGAEPEEITQGDSTEASYLRWTRGEVYISLYTSYGMVSVEFSPVNG